jgi:hypothetical protein
MRFKLAISLVVFSVLPLSACGDGGPDPDKVPRTVPPELLSAPQSVPRHGVGPIYEANSVVSRRNV